MTQKLTTVIPAVLNQIRPGTTFMAVMGYTNKFGEVSDFGLVFHVSYHNAVKKALGMWLNYTPQTRDEGRAKVALLASYRDTLNGFNHRALSAHAYDRVVDGNRNLIKGVKWYRDGQEVHLWAFRVHKRVLRQGMYEPVLHDGLTMAKAKLMSMTPLRNFRQFKIIQSRFEQIRVDHLTLTHKDLLRKLQ